MSSEEMIFNGKLEDLKWSDDNGNSIDNKDLNNFLEEKSKKNFQEAIEKYMPIGSVLKLKDKIGNFMIIGFKYKINDVEFDYLGIKYPEGVNKDINPIVFNHEEIEKIFHVGMTSNIQRKYNQELHGENTGFNMTL